jgi:hypothetical protein
VRAKQAPPLFACLKAGKRLLISEQAELDRNTDSVLSRVKSLEDAIAEAASEVLPRRLDSAFLLGLSIDELALKAQVIVDIGVDRGELLQRLHLPEPEAWPVLVVGTAGGCSPPGCWSSGRLPASRRC